ncbi:hypothetical protein ATANTOWER_025987 [Ataeniobius toweri]|uniref:Uncharacterized protein n=1 Tax=Ataeniobius toweri TaxID=208326 RepID=A0ABU7B2E5_9TELE|nr:hypothetical protein [Ataeniobius toweri]
MGSVSVICETEVGRDVSVIRPGGRILTVLCSCRDLFLSLIRLLSLTAKLISPFKVLGSSINANSSFNGSFKDWKKAALSAQSFQPEAAARVRKSMENSATDWFLCLIDHNLRAVAVKSISQEKNLSKLLLKIRECTTKI